MCSYFKWMVPAVVIAVAIMLSTAPATTGASPSFPGDHCGPVTDCEDVTSQSCCTNPECQLYYCSLPGGIETNVATSFHTVSRPGVCTVTKKTTARQNESLKVYTLSENRPAQDMPLHLYTSYFCRNSLSSEEPALL